MWQHMSKVFTSAEKCSSQLCACVFFSPLRQKVYSRKTLGVVSTHKTYHKANRCDGLQCRDTWPINWRQWYTKKSNQEPQAEEREKEALLTCLSFYVFIPETEAHQSVCLTLEPSAVTSQPVLQGPTTKLTCAKVCNDQLVKKCQVRKHTATDPKSGCVIICCFFLMKTGAGPPTGCKARFNLGAGCFYFPVVQEGWST